MADPNEILMQSQKNNVAAIEALITAGVDPSTANGVGQTGLHVACLWGNFESADLLVKKGANVNLPNSFNGATPVHCCAQDNERGNPEGRKKCVALLVGSGADVNVKDARGKKPFQLSTNDEIRAMLGGPPYDSAAEEEEGEDDEDDMEFLPDSEKTPVTLVTGFLGSGKTTLINYILTERHGKKIAVVENEFGAVDIDSSLVTANLQAKEDVISMDNGCVCCTVRGDLVRAFITLSERDEKYDAVIIETTGMADPAPVAFTFNSRPEVGAKFRIDAILCVVDAKHIKQHLDEVRETGVINEAVNQVAFADRILLNKIDLVTEEEKQAVRKTLRSINAIATIVECERSRVDLDQLLGIGSFSLDNVSHLLEQLEEEEEEPADDGHGHGHSHEHGSCSEAGCGHEGGHEHGHGHGHGHEAEPDKKKPKRSAHISGVSSVGIEVDGELDEQKFNGFMSHLISTKKDDLFRSKGVIKFKQSPMKFVFHGVHEQIEFGPTEEPWKDGEKRVRMVFIGKNLNKEELQKGLNACVA